MNAFEGRWDKEPGQSCRQWRLCRERVWPRSQGRERKERQMKEHEERWHRRGLLSLIGSSATRSEGQLRLGRNKVKQLEETEGRGKAYSWKDKRAVETDLKTAEENKPIWKSKREKKVFFFFFLTGKKPTVKTWTSILQQIKTWKGF